MAFEIVPLTNERYAEWDAFCHESDDAWFWHTASWIEYTLRYKPELKPRNFSFLVYRGSAIKAIVPLILETSRSGGDDIREFSFGGGAAPAPALCGSSRKENDRHERDVIADAIFAEIDRRARNLGVHRAQIRQTSLAPSSLHGETAFNQAMKFGYIDASLNTRLIDLRLPEQELWNAMRRNHIRNIRKSAEYGFDVYTRTTITRTIFDQYKETHHKDAGRKTRPDETFDLMYEWIMKGAGFLGVISIEQKPASFLYYIAYKDAVYGASAAREPELAYLPLRHALEWRAIQWMKQSGYLVYEIGLQQFGPLPHDIPDKKQLDITHFKRGFGGKIVPLFVAEKYYDKDYFLKTQSERMRRFSDFL